MTKEKTTLHTGNQGLREGMTQIASSNTSVNAYYAVPEQASSAPLILVVQEIFGINDHVQDICRRYAHEGYMAVAVDLYQRQGDASSYDDIPTLIKELVARIPDEQVMADLDAAVEWAATHGADTSRLGITGFCWGGRIIWLYCVHNPQCKAGVAWYGKLTQGHGPLQVRNPIDVARELFAPVLGLYGGQDTSISAQDIERMQTALSQGNDAAQASTFVVYPDAGHAFFADYRPSYRADDARDAWDKSLDWFKKYL